MDQVGQTPGRVGKGVSRSTQLLGRSARVWDGLARALVATRLHEEETPKSVEAAPPSRAATWLGRPITTWRQTDLTKLVEVPFTPINTPLTMKVEIPHSTYSSLLVKVLV
jgi:hypothetical protein